MDSRQEKNKANRFHRNVIRLLVVVQGTLTNGTVQALISGTISQHKLVKNVIRQCTNILPKSIDRYSQ